MLVLSLRYLFAPVLGVALIFCTFATGAEAATRVTANCAKDGSIVSCEVLSDEIKPIKDVTALSGTQVLSGNEFENFNAASRISAWYFLVQQSSHPKDALLSIERMLVHTDKRQYGLAFFTDKLDEKAKLGASKSEIARLKDSVTLAKGAKAELYSAAEEAVRKLLAIKADRRSIVIFSDGSTASTAYRDKFVQAVKDNNILVHIVQMGNGGSPKILQELASDTRGLLEVAEPCVGKNCDNFNFTVSKAFGDNFTAYLENGGTLKIKSSIPSGADLTIRVNYADGSSATSDRIDVTKLSSVKPGPDPVPLPTPTGYMKYLPQIVQENPTISAAIAGTGLLAMLGGVLWVSRRGRRELPIHDGEHLGDDFHPTGGTRAYRGGAAATTVMSNSDTVVLSPGIDRNPPAHVYAWLQFLDQASTRIPIGETSVRIGRHKDNDVCLDNKTVHRQHAVLHMTPDKRFSIRDLGTVNGLVINSQKCSQKELTDGDMIELGEVRLRFFSNNESIH